ncbi:hypothetical protein R3P38DRAFT_823149 [Favolaschia claudopus]|uniref:C2H2-type domain-containing protein n=1 Tax=Favolaschia claudopus TaxID=2862362 RepID=A0AAW0BZF3_9AGAR
MPVKKKGDFVVPDVNVTKAVQAAKKTQPKKKKKDDAESSVQPGAKDASTGFVNVVAGSSSHRNFAAEVKAIHGTRDAMEADTARFDVRHLKPIALSTEKRIKACERYYIDYFTQLLGGVDKARATLNPDAPFPPLPHMKQYMYFVAVYGKSGFGIPGVTGWSVHTTRKFLGRTFSMMRRAGVTAPTRHERDELMNAITTWSNDKLLNSHRRDKRILREQDLRDLLTVCMQASLPIKTNSQRLQIMALCAFLYTHGSRPGSIVESHYYKGEGQYLKWGDSEWVVYGWDEGVGLGVQSFWTFNWYKNMRNDDSLKIKTNMHNLGRAHADMDPQLILEALAIDADIFEEDLLALRKADPKDLKFPIRLTIKAEARERPVFVAADTEGPLTLSASQHHVAKIRKALGWSDFSLLSFRYSFASSLIDRVSKTHLRYLMGHAQSSYHAQTTYQAPDRPVDVTGSRFNEENPAFASLSEAHSSVSWNRVAAPSDEKVYGDIYLKKLTQDYADCEQEVKAKFGEDASSQQLLEAGKSDKCVVDAVEKLAEMLEYYLSLSSGSYVPLPPRSATAASSTSSGSATPSAPSRSMTPADATPSTSSSSSDASARLVESMMQVWVTADDAHPFQALIALEPVNPRLAIIQRYLALLQLDREDLKGRCIYCLSNEELSEHDRNKDHAQHFAQHFSTCELDHHPNHWRCPICVTLVPVPPKGCGFPTIATARPSDDDETLDKMEVEALHEAAAEHASECFKRFMRVLRGEPEDDDEDKALDEDGLPLLDADVSMPLAPPSTTKPDNASASSSKPVSTSSSKASSSRSKRSASMVSVSEPRGSAYDSDATMASGNDSDISMRSVLSARSIAGSHQKKNKEVDDGGAGARVLCVQIAFTQKFQGRQGRLQTYFFCPVCLFDTTLSWYQRFITNPDLPKLMIHMTTHWNQDPIDYDKEFVCGFPQCGSLDGLATGDYIMHLHQEHEYKLVQCTTHCNFDECDPRHCTKDHHDDSCFTLPSKQFLFHEDALTYADARMGKHQRALPTATLADNRKGALKKARMEAIFKRHKVTKFAPDIPKKPKAVKGKGKAKAPAIDPAAVRLQTCLFEIMANSPQFCGINIKKLTDAGVTVEALATLARNKIPPCDYTFTLQTYVAFSNGVKKWLEDGAITDCDVMLKEVFPDSVKKLNMPATMAAMNLKVGDLVGLSAEDATEMGFVADDELWERIRAVIKDWLAGRGST